jgi:5-methylcytosine-specific restriction endonuclease McrA
MPVQVSPLTPQEYWRAIVLYGNNVATYKLALADCLIAFAEQQVTCVTMHELARAFLVRYRDRLASGLPQQSNPQRKTVLERIVAAYQAGDLTEAAGVQRVAQQGFDDVVPRFHVVNGIPVPLAFYEQTATGLVLTDALLGLFGSRPRPDLRAEVAGRWDLVEAAFAMRLPAEVLGTDEHMLYRTDGHARVDITGMRPILNGYQNGLCFYCGEPLEGAAVQVYVDHVIPRTFLRHDEIWNLVLAHGACNLAKSAQLPAPRYLERLYERNEYYIASNHPIKRHLIRQLGATPAGRQSFLQQVYTDATRMLIHIWPGHPPGRALGDHPLAPLRLVGGG